MWDKYLGKIAPESAAKGGRGRRVRTGSFR